MDTFAATGYICYANFNAYNAICVVYNVHVAPSHHFEFIFMTLVHLFAYVRGAVLIAACEHCGGMRGSFRRIRAILFSYIAAASCMQK